MPDPRASTIGIVLSLCSQNILDGVVAQSSVSVRLLTPELMACKPTCHIDGAMSCAEHIIITAVWLTLWSLPLMAKRKSTSSDKAAKAKALKTESQQIEGQSDHVRKLVEWLLIRWNLTGFSWPVLGVSFFPLLSIQHLLCLAFLRYIYIYIIIYSPQCVALWCSACCWQSSFSRKTYQYIE